MKLDEILTYFNNDELLDFIPSELKPYLPKIIDKNSIVEYIKMNIISLLDKKQFVVPFLKKISERKNISSLISGKFILLQPYSDNLEDNSFQCLYISAMFLASLFSTTYTSAKYLTPSSINSCFSFLILKS